MAKAALVLSAVLLLALTAEAFAFQNEPEGFRGLKWGGPPGKDMKYWGKSTEHDNTLWYKRKNDQLQIGNANLKDIFYLFYQEKFMAVVMDLAGGEKDYDSLVDVLNLKFGKGKEQGFFWRMTTLFDDTTAELQWSGDITRITLYKKWGDDSSKGKLEIESIQIIDQRKADEERERQKAAEKGLDDF